MKKVVMIHGLNSSPNGGWRPWLMSELGKKDVYAVSLPLPKPEAPKVEGWVNTIKRYVDENPDDEIYLVGHSLGVPAILKYLEIADKSITGAVLVSGPIEDLNREDIREFLIEFNFNKIKTKAKKFVVIHGDNDDRVPFTHAEKLSKELNCELVSIKNGGHLNGRSGWDKLPQCLEVLDKMIYEKRN